MATYVAVYIVGVFVAYVIATIELNADNYSEGRETTVGEKALCVIVSLCSWCCVIFSLISGWRKMISQSGYWSKPLKSKQNKSE